MYHRFRFGIFVTLTVALLASLLAYVELAIQGRESWVIGWYALLCLVLLLRWQDLQKFLRLPNRINTGTSAFSSEWRSPGRCSAAAPLH